MTIGGKSNPLGRFMRKGKRWKVFLDGVLIFSVFYLDRRRRILKTFDVLDNGAIATATRGCPFPIDPSWDAPIGGVLSKTIKWKPRQKLIIRRIY
jgi:hypothetical protein